MYRVVMRRIRESFFHILIGILLGNKIGNVIIKVIIFLHFRRGIYIVGRCSLAGD